MSSKKQKELRKFMKKMSIELDRNEELYEKGAEWFNHEDFLNEWFEKACFMKLMDPTLSNEILMPDMLPHLMYEADLIKEEEIDQELYKVCSLKMEEVVENIKRNQLF